MKDQVPAREWEAAGNRYSDDDKILHGHRRIHCRACGFKGWSDDCGACPRDWCPSHRGEEAR